MLHIISNKKQAICYLMSDNLIIWSMLKATMLLLLVILYLWLGLKLAVSLTETAADWTTAVVSRASCGSQMADMSQMKTRCPCTAPVFFCARPRLKRNETNCHAVNSADSDVVFSACYLSILPHLLWPIRSQLHYSLLLHWTFPEKPEYWLPWVSTLKADTCRVITVR